MRPQDAKGLAGPRPCAGLAGFRDAGGGRAKFGLYEQALIREGGRLRMAALQRRMVVLGFQAANVLQRAMDSERVLDQVRAANSLLSYLLQLRELLEVEGRIEGLEGQG